MCALLTPAIKGKFQTMSAGQILEIRVNDPTAREDIASWCRLSGHELLAEIAESSQPLYPVAGRCWLCHELLAEIEESPQLLRVFIRKRQG
jgi:TusA-related sulfurtransferase